MASNLIDALKKSVVEQAPVDNSVDFTSLTATTQKRGGLPAAIVAQIQAIYNKAETNTTAKGTIETPAIGPGPGWGGKGL